jgi:hypothetical protein
MSTKRATCDVVESEMEGNDNPYIRTWELVCDDHTIKASADNYAGDQFGWFLTLKCISPPCSVVVTILEPTTIRHSAWMEFIETPDSCLNFNQGNEDVHIEFANDLFVYHSRSLLHGDMETEVRMPAETVRRVLKTVIQAQHDADKLLL